MSTQNYRYQKKAESFITKNIRGVFSPRMLIALVIGIAIIIYATFYKFNVTLTPKINTTEKMLPKKKVGKLTKEDNMYMNTEKITGSVKAYKSGNAGDSIILITNESDPWPAELTLPIDLNQNPPAIGSTCNIDAENWGDDPAVGWEYCLAKE